MPFAHEADFPGHRVPEPGRAAPHCIVTLLFCLMGPHSLTGEKQTSLLVSEPRSTQRVPAGQAGTFDL